MSLYVEISLNTNDIINESKLYENVILDLKKVGIINSHKVLAHQMLVLNPAYVHITTESIGIFRKWCEKYNKKDIYSIGRYGSWTYCSIEDNILEAEKTSKLL